ncbi:MAG: aminotransferase class V-fold PLP-dependent enzyme [Pseudomonadota bacterium]
MNHPGTASDSWTLDPDVTFLNHGSFGACPRSVQDAQREFRAALEREPVDFLLHAYPELLDAARDALARFVGTAPDTLAFVPNATTGVNTVLRSLHFNPNDEILVTDQGYNACTNAARYVAARFRARIVTATLPWPIASDDEIVASIVAAVTPRTRLAIIDHVTSPTAVVLPVAEITRALQSEGVQVIVDGAHAPGMLELSLPGIGADYYTGNCHKWMCAPKGAAFLHVRADRQDGIVPLTISHGWNVRRDGRSLFHDTFDWTGTSDPSAVLSVPAAIAALGSWLDGGVGALRARNRDLAIQAREILLEAIPDVPVCGPDLLGAMAAVSLPASLANTYPGAYAFHRRLRAAGFEVPVQAGPRDRLLLRVSAQIYNDGAQYQALADALPDLIESAANGR